MNSREWRELRAAKLASEPLCERCKAEGYVVSARCIHHIIPVESGRTDAECWELATRWSNLQSLCYQCHSDIHKYMGKSKNHVERSKQNLQRWIERHTKNNGKQFQILTGDTK